MRLRPFISGFLAGAAVTAGVFLLFGNRIFGGVDQATRQLGEKVEQVGRDIERSGKKLQD